MGNPKVPTGLSAKLRYFLQFLQDNGTVGAKGDPGATGPAGPQGANGADSRTLLSTASAVGVPSLVLTGMTGYKHYLIEIEGTRPDVGSNRLKLQVSTDGGNTWDTSVLVYTTNGVNNSSVELAPPMSSNSTENANGYIDVYQAASGTKTVFNVQMIYYTNVSEIRRSYVAYDYVPTSAVNAVKIFSYAVTLTGTIRLYGIV